MQGFNVVILNLTTPIKQKKYIFISSFFCIVIGEYACLRTEGMQLKNNNLSYMLIFFNCLNIKGLFVKYYLCIKACINRFS